MESNCEWTPGFGRGSLQLVPESVDTRYEPVAVQMSSAVAMSEPSSRARRP
jgi:hypothetical protein